MHLFCFSNSVVLFCKAFVNLIDSLIDRRGYVVPDSSQINHGVHVVNGKEHNAVNIKHEYYGSTQVTKVRLEMFPYRPVFG